MPILMKHRGFTLIEVMIAFFILAVSLMGLTALMARSIQGNQGAYLRTQATYVASGMADRIRANLDADYASLTASNSPVCVRATETGCSSTDMARYDLWQFSQEMGLLPLGQSLVCRDSTPFDGVNNTSAACDGSGELAIKIWWDEDRSGAVDASDPRVTLVVR